MQTFKGRNPSDVLARIREEIGPDAVILHTRTGRSGGVLGIGAKPWAEIIAAPADTPPRERRAPSRPSVEPTKTGYTRTRSVTPARPERPAPVATAAAPSPVRQVAKRIVEPSRRPSTGIATTKADTAPSMRAEIEEIRKMVGHVLRTSGGAQPSMPEALFEHYRRLLEAEVAVELADTIVGDIRDALSPAQLRQGEEVRRAVLERLALHIPAESSPPRVERRASGEPALIAFVGPTGVGKTTTLAKLAATYRLREGKRVGMITCDTYRIAAVEQLRTYAGIIGVAMETAMTPADVKRAIDALKNCDVILMDTAGRSPHDAERLRDLGTLLQAARPDQVHLVLSSTMSTSTLHLAAERFGCVSPNHVIFTKLDEAVNVGVILGVAERLNARMSYITSGQEVPDDIDAVVPARLAEMVIDGPARAA